MFLKRSCQTDRNNGSETLLFDSVMHTFGLLGEYMK